MRPTHRISSRLVVEDSGKRCPLGITKEDIEEQGLPLPKKDFMPITIEEKIICHADSLIKGTEVKDIQYVIERYKKEVSQKIADRAYKLYLEVEK